MQLYHKYIVESARGQVYAPSQPIEGGEYDQSLYKKGVQYNFLTGIESRNSFSSIKYDIFFKPIPISLLSQAIEYNLVCIPTSHT